MVGSAHWGSVLDAGIIGLMDTWQKGAPEDSRDISGGEVHLWRVLMSLTPAGQTDSAREVLAPDERERADQFHFDRDRRRYIEARAALRQILAGYAGTRPSAVTFAAGPHGKPQLVNVSSPIRFSTARSGRVGLIAVACDADVGVDVELIVDDFPWREVATRVFTSLELQPIEAMAEREQVRGFVRAWVRKEAWAKATGLGIAHVLDSDHDIPDLGPIHTYDLCPLNGYLGALSSDSERSAISLLDCGYG